MDAPAHFYNGVPTIEQVPLDQCIGPAALIDVRQIGPRGEITPATSHRARKRSKPPARSSSGPAGPAAGARTITSMTTRY